MFCFFVFFYRGKKLTWLGNLSTKFCSREKSPSGSYRGKSGFNVEDSIKKN